MPARERSTTPPASSWPSRSITSAARPEDRLYAIAHRYEVNGDLVPDPDVEFYVVEDPSAPLGKAVYPTAIDHGPLRYHRYVDVDTDSRPTRFARARPRGSRDLLRYVDEEHRRPTGAATPVTVAFRASLRLHARPSPAPYRSNPILRLPDFGSAFICRTSCASRSMSSTSTSMTEAVRSWLRSSFSTRAATSLFAGDQLPYANEGADDHDVHLNRRVRS